MECTRGAEYLASEQQDRENFINAASAGHDANTVITKLVIDTDPKLRCKILSIGAFRASGIFLELYTDLELLPFAHDQHGPCIKIKCLIFEVTIST